MSSTSGARVTRMDDVARGPRTDAGHLEEVEPQVFSLALGRHDEVARVEPPRHVDDRAHARCRPAEHLGTVLGDGRGRGEQQVRSRGRAVACRSTGVAEPVEPVDTELVDADLIPEFGGEARRAPCARPSPRPAAR